MDPIGAVMKVAEEASRGVMQDRYLCILVTRDVRKACNLALWHLIDAALDRRNVPSYLRAIIKCYLNNRSLVVHHEGFGLVTNDVWSFAGIGSGSSIMKHFL